MVTCLFAHSLRKFSMRDWGIEQKWMSILLPLLLLYNDPFFPLSFLVNSWFPGMLDDLFQSLFLCALLLFWLCVYHGIRVQGERKCLTFYLPKFLIVGLLWLASVTLGVWQTVNEVHDPTYQYRVDTGNFQGMKIFFLVVATTYILYLLFLIVRACSELRNMPYVDLRLKFLTALTFVVLVISIVILYLRFGAQVLQDNFVAELSTHYQNSAEFLSFYGLLNFYLYTLAFVYSPSKNALYESQLKDNPAFSMLNDSDDDVIYGSDYEEMPLQNGQAIRAKFKEESDSDWWSDFDTDRLVQLELRLFWSFPRWTASLAYLQSAVIWTWNSRKDVLLLFLFTKVKLKRKECLKRLWWELKETRIYMHLMKCLMAGCLWTNV